MKPHKSGLPEETKAFIKSNFLKLTNAVLSEKTGVPITTLRTYAYSIGLKKTENEAWVSDAVEFLEFVYRDIGDMEIAAYLDVYYPKFKKWTISHVSKKMGYLSLKRSTEELKRIKYRSLLMGSYKRGIVKRWETIGIKPLGSVVERKDGNRLTRVMIRTEEGFVHRNPWLWEQHFGKPPEGMVVSVRDGAPLIADISDLYLRTKAQVMFDVQTCDKTIVKRDFRIKDPAAVTEFIEKYPELIELKRNEIKLNGKLRELKRSVASPGG